MREFVTERLFAFAEKNPAKTAIVDPVCSVTYGELAAMVYGVAGALRSLGLGAGDAVLVEAVPRAEYAMLVYGIHLAGCVNVPVENRVPADRLREIAERVGAKLILAGSDPGCGVRTLRIADMISLALPYAEQWTPGTSLSYPDPALRGEILFTTGSTGRSKGVCQTRAAVSSYLEAMNTALSMHEGTVLLVVTPLNHAGGLHRMHMTLHCGGTLVLLDGMTDLRAFYDAIDRYSVNTLYLPPSGVHILLLLSAKKLAALDGRLDFVFTASAPFPQGDREKMRALLPNTRLIEAYGGSEVGSVCCCNYNDPGYIPGCMGKPYPCVELRIEDELISIRSPMLMEGYLDDPELTEKVLRDGWFRTSDRGRLDEEGRLFFLGRSDDVINVGGKKVAPSELEEVVLTLPGVADCAVMPVEDAAAGTVLCLLVVQKPGTEFSPRELIAALRGKVEDYKIPYFIREIHAVPRFPNGKIDRKRLSSAQ